MKKIWNWYNRLPNRVRSSIIWALSIVGFISTIFTLIGISINGMVHQFWISLVIVLVALIVSFIVVYIIIGQVYKDSVEITVRNTAVSIGSGNIFEAPGWRVIGCDTHFDTRVDDIVISKSSLHGQLVLNHGTAEEIRYVVEQEAKRQGLMPNIDNLYTFPLGTIIPYHSSVDNETYLMLAMTELNDQFEAHTNMSQYEQMLMKMWQEIDRVYAKNNLALPVLGSGITRFDDGPKGNDAFLRCMLCTLNSSGVTLKSNVHIVIYGEAKDIPLYEYKDMFRTIT